MPETVRGLADAHRTPWLAWRIVIAPFAAVMSGFGSFLPVVFPLSFEMFINETSIQTQANGKSSGLTYGGTTGVGAASSLSVLDHPQYLQSMIVLAAGGLAGCFLMPMVLVLFWARTTRADSHFRSDWVAVAW